MTYTYEYPRPAVTVDIMIFSSKKSDAEILLIQRKNDPFKGEWALPGGFIEMDETLEHAALRELQEETGISKITIEQFHTYGNPGRDPRGRTISIIFYGFINKNTSCAHAGDDAENLDWHSVKNLPKLAFDHNVILKSAIKKLLKPDK